MADTNQTTVSQGPPDTLATRLERWISIAKHQGCGTMTGSDWESLESVLVQSLLRIRRGPVSEETRLAMVEGQRKRREQESANGK